MGPGRRQNCKITLQVNPKTAGSEQIGLIYLHIYDRNNSATDRSISLKFGI